MWPLYFQRILPAFATTTSWELYFKDKLLEPKTIEYLTSKKERLLTRADQVNCYIAVLLLITTKIVNTQYILGLGSPVVNSDICLLRMVSTVNFY